jgi:hypothetical protein
MWLAVFEGIVFVVLGFYVEGAISIGLVAFNLVGNHLMQKSDARRAQNETPPTTT